MSSTNKLKILCLHGYRQNDTLFREKTGVLRKQFKKHADFEFVCAPLEPKIDGNADRESPRGWWFSKSDDQFSSRDVTEIATGYTDSARIVADHIANNGPYDGILGFSQGASMTHLLLAMEQLGEVKLGDEIVLKPTSEKLQSMFSNSISIVHEGGHFIPTMSKYKDVFISFLVDQQSS